MSQKYHDWNVIFSRAVMPHFRTVELRYVHVNVSCDNTAAHTSATLQRAEVQPCDSSCKRCVVMVVPREAATTEMDGAATDIVPSRRLWSPISND